MKEETDKRGDSSTAIAIEGLRLSPEERAAVKRGLTIALVQARREGVQFQSR